MHDASDGNIKCCVLFCFLSPPSCLIAKRGAQRNGISVVDISFRWSRESNWREQRHAVFLQRYISWIQPLVEFEPAGHVQDQLCHNHQQSWFVVQDDGCWDPHREFRGGQRQQEPNVILENISVSRYNLIINQNYPLIFLSFCRFSQLCSNFLHPERRHPHLQLWRDDRPVRQPEARLPKPFSCIDGVWGGGVRRLVNCSPKVSKCVSQQKIKSVTQSHFFPELVVPAPSFSTVVMGRNVTVVEKKLCWSDALFYCRDFHWDLLSIRSKQEQRKVEEALKKVSFPLTHHVWFGRRR